ncbi:unnamed protein product [Chondrus crispus]|uniref:Uncharacterized protein n=1 Tax=Chondrus crispus TaxID=2769 RepID=R7Q240_CHOCR|nr:unnamed protein product [Chondrus crispus]CDF32657.1 unnamed protein product [Chondrus crispus]|eukprot:XP_005712428.1 unnamed protein product [Chondrus crispus]
MSCFPAGALMGKRLRQLSVEIQCDGDLKGSVSRFRGTVCGGGGKERDGLDH